MGTDFKKARFELIATYLLIIAGIVVLFSLLIIYQAKSSFSDPFVSGDKHILLTAEDAQNSAKQLHKGVAVKETEYEIENDSLYLTTTFVDESETKINLFTGEVHVPKENTSFFYAFVDDFDEKVWWVALLVFLLAATLSAYVANQTLTPIAQNIRKQKEFVSGAAHELRNPLAALHARIESALRLGIQLTNRELLTDLLGETKRLISLSEGLLSLERSERHPKIQEQDVSFSEIIPSLIQRTADMAKAKAITLHTDIAPGTLRIDPVDLETILYNLIHNAIKFTLQSGKVTLVWKDKTLSVSDTGMGIPSSEIPHIFDRFYKVDTARGGEGNGLGLALVKEIVKKYGAQIRVESTLGKGSRFIITFT